MKKKSKHDNGILETFITAAIESAPQKSILIPNHEILAQLHCLLIIPFGMGKSTISRSIPNSYLSLSHSLPAILGTINKEGELVDSALLNSRNKVLLLDEMHRLSSSSVDAMLNLLESGYYMRSLGYKIKNEIKCPYTLEKDGYNIQVNESKNGFEIRTKFSCIGFAEWVPKHFEQALLSRFATIRMLTNKEMAFRISRGESLIDEIKLKTFKVYKKSVNFKDTYYDFIDAIEQRVNTLNIQFPDCQAGYYTRVNAHLIKLAAHFARMRGSLTVIKEDWEKTLDYIPILLYNLKSATLTPIQYKIYELALLGNTQYNISKLTGYSPGTISYTVNRLKTLGLIVNDVVEGNPPVTEEEVLTDIKKQI